MKLRRLFVAASLAFSVFAVGTYAAPLESNAATKPAGASKKAGTPRKASKASSAKGSKATSTAPRKTSAKPAAAKARSYTNVDGKRVQSPTKSATVPKSASARCGDGSYSFSAHRQGTCSHHGGVSAWLK
jgi:hypothetical protein